MDEKATKELKQAIANETDSVKRAHLRRQLAGPAAIEQFTEHDTRKRDEKRKLISEVASIGRANKKAMGEGKETGNAKPKAADAGQGVDPETKPTPAAVVAARGESDGKAGDGIVNENKGPVIVEQPVTEADPDEGPVTIVDPQDALPADEGPAIVLDPRHERGRGNEGGERSTRLKALSEGLDDGDFTADGKPNVNAVNALLDEGEDAFTAEERDELWSADA